MRVGKLFLCIVGAAVGAIVLIPIGTYRQSQSKLDQIELDFPFTLRGEKRLDGVGPPVWKAAIILPREHYSQENLDRLFRWYSNKHPNPEERLDVVVYTDEKNIPPPIVNTPTAILHTPIQTDAPQPPSESRLTAYDAVLHRMKGSAAATGGGENEWYIYSPDLDDPNTDKRVVLKGTDPFALKNILETWEPKHPGFRFRIIAYELVNVEPRGIYYTVQSCEAGAECWESIMTFRKGGEVAIPREQVRFLSNRIAYVYLGWMFAVTMDGGGNWFVWDAKRELANQQCCENDFIEDVQISPTGVGTMKFNLTSQGQRLDLYTKDFGAHWNSK
jgi:hypothetical protein